MFYAVRNGRQAGIFSSWDECKQQVVGFKGAVYKRLDTVEEAQEYLQPTQMQAQINNDLPFAFIDGSFSKSKQVYGCGGFIHTGSECIILQKTGNNADFLPEQHIAGELLGTLQVLHYCMKAQLPEVNICYDYAGIENYVNGSWQASTKLAQYYASTVDLIMQRGVQPHFIKVEGHTGIKGNDLADYLAKEATGAKLRKQAIAVLASFKKSPLDVIPDLTAATGNSSEN